MLVSDALPVSQDALQAENTCSLTDLAEGQVGKLLVRKSGRVQLVLGKVKLDIAMGTPCSFLQVSPYSDARSEVTLRNGMSTRCFAGNRAI